MMTFPFSNELRVQERPQEGMLELSLSLSREEALFWAACFAKGNSAGRPVCSSHCSTCGLWESSWLSVRRSSTCCRRACRASCFSQMSFSSIFMDCSISCFMPICISTSFSTSCRGQTSSFSHATFSGLTTHGHQFIMKSLPYLFWSKLQELSTVKIQPSQKLALG